MTVRPGLGAAVAILALAAPQSAFGQDATGQIYVQGFGGANWLDDIQFRQQATTADGSYDVGYGIGGAVGFEFGNVRIESEISFRENDLDGLNTTANTTGDVSAFALMLNAYYDFESDSNFTPYIGAGLGASEVEASLAGSAAGLSQTYSESGWGLTIQGIGGASYAVSDVVELFAEGRVTTVLDPDISGVPTPPLGAGPLSVESDYLSYGLFAGVRFHFGMPP